MSIKMKTPCCGLVFYGENHNPIINNFCRHCAHNFDSERLEKAEKVLEFYASDGSYHPIQISPNPDCSGIHYCEDEGEKARQYFKDKKDRTS